MQLLMLVIVLVILITILTKFNTIFDLLILTEHNIAKGIAIKLPIIEPKIEIFIVSTNGGNNILCITKIWREHIF